MTDLLSSVIEATSHSPRNVVSSNHDVNSINWVRGMSDPGEMISCGYLPQLRRLPNEADADYAKRIMPIIMSLPLDERTRIIQTGMQSAIRRANLNVTNGKVSMFSALVPPWHGLGVVLDGTANTAEALKAANLANWDLRKVEQWIDWNGNKVATGSFAIVRQDTGKVLTHGTSVGSRYQILSNEECFDFMDGVIAGGAQYETAGAIGNGETVWLLAKYPEIVRHAPGDESYTYLAFGTSHDGSSSIWCYPTNLRIECANTNRLALQGKRLGVNFRHTTNVKTKAKQAAEALGLAKRNNERYEALSHSLVEQRMLRPEAYFNVVLDDVLCKTEAYQIAGQTMTKANLDSGELLKAVMTITDADERNTEEKRMKRAVETHKELLVDILERFESERNNNKPSIQGSAWAAYNAVTEHADHSPLYRFRGTDTQRKESRFNSVLNGRAQEIKETALELVLAQAN